MRMQHARLKTKSRALRSLTGLNPNEFEALLRSFSVAWDSFVKETFERPNRKRAYGTERPINRPKNKADQKRYYSGKKSRHTVKNNLITERGGKVVYLSRTYEGKRHDKKIADEENYCFPSGSKLLQETGFQGYGPAGATVIQPKKKPRGGELTPTEKLLNRAISSLRVEVEHQIGGVKRAQIVVQKFRNRMANFADEVMETACGLHNFRLAHR